MFRKTIVSLSILASLVLGATGCSNPLDDDEHEDAVGVDVTDLGGSLLAQYRVSTGVWTYANSSDALQLTAGTNREVRIYFVTAAGSRFQEPATGGDHTHRVQIANTAVAQYQGAADQGTFQGVSVGETTAVVQLWHGSHADFATNPGMTVRVVAAP